MKSETIVGLFVMAAIAIFFYLTFIIGVFQFNTTTYDQYGAYFADSAGLEVKDAVRIAGVTVGCVKEISLKDDRALVWFWIEHRYRLGSNAHAVIAQQGLLGNKHVEVDPGDSSAGYLAPGNILVESSAAAPSIGEVVGNLQTHVFPAVRDAGRGIATLADRAQPTLEHLEHASRSARDGFAQFGEVAYKINNGSGFIGKLMHDDESYRDITKTLKEFKRYSDKMAALDVLLDMHSETMLRNWNSKGYFEMKLRPTSDYFYQIQILTDERGSVYRQFVETARFDAAGNVLHAPNESDLYRNPPAFYQEIQTRNSILFGFQFGKRFNRLAFRIGLFESTFGMAMDWYLPIPTDYVHWISTMELFDIKGYNRLNDTRPHLKWINRVYFLRNLYLTFGMDDIVSKNNQNPFVGGGLRFSDKDLKYFLGSLPLTTILGSGSNAFRPSAGALPT